MVVVGDQVNVEILCIFTVKRIIDDGVFVELFNGVFVGFLGQFLD